MIRFYFHHTPNPMKVALFLEEAGMPYEVIPVDTLKGEQHTPEFRAINPNGKLPAIVDTDGVGGETAVFDSSAILLYLGDKIGRFTGQPADHGQLLSWLMFVASGIGPYSGQAVHFKRAAPEKLAYPIQRYQSEAERHYKVLDGHLAGREYIVGTEYTIVDMSAWGWIDRAAIVIGESGLADFPNIKRWFDVVNARPAVAKARALAANSQFKRDMDEAAKRHLFPSMFVQAAD